MSAFEQARGDDAVIGPSNRSFGFLFSGVFLVVGLLPLWRSGEPRSWALMVSALFGMLALLWPSALAPANRLWLRVGLVNPVVMGVLFYGAVTPFGLVMRLSRKGLTRTLRFDTAASTYWVKRDDRPSRMDQQF
jgi:hypothetical protein